MSAVSSDDPVKTAESLRSPGHSMRMFEPEDCARRVETVMIDWEGLQSVIDWDEFPIGWSPIRRIRVICRHTCTDLSLPTHEFPEKVELAPFWIDGDRESFNGCKWSDITVRQPGEKRWEF